MSLRQSGYRTIFLTSGDFLGWRRLDELIDERSFDQVKVISDRSGCKGWPESDRKVLAEARRSLTEGGSRPAFVMAFLMSTHFPYCSPPEFQVLGHQRKLFTYITADRRGAGDLDRYHNACRFLESEIMKLIEHLDLDRTIVIITGDHGESFGEDGFGTHGTCASDIQTLVPFVIAGPGVQPGTADFPTSHVDVLPTLLHALAANPIPITYTDGRDLLAGKPLAQEVVYVAQPRQQLIVLRADKRFLFSFCRAGKGKDRVLFEGLVDENGVPVRPLVSNPRHSGEVHR